MKVNFLAFCSMGQNFYALNSLLSLNHLICEDVHFICSLIMSALNYSDWAINWVSFQLGWILLWRLKDVLESSGLWIHYGFLGFYLRFLMDMHCKILGLMFESNLWDLSSESVVNSSINVRTFLNMWRWHNPGII